MSHLGQEAIRRILSGEAGPQEAEAAALHLVSCDRCRTLADIVADLLRSQRTAADGSRQLMADLVEREVRRAIDSLVAPADRRGQRPAAGGRKPTGESG